MAHAVASRRGYLVIDSRAIVDHLNQVRQPRLAEQPVETTVEQRPVLVKHGHVDGYHQIVQLRLPAAGNITGRSRQDRNHCRTVIMKIAAQKHTSS